VKAALPKRRRRRMASIDLLVILGLQEVELLFDPLNRLDDGQLEAAGLTLTLKPIC
jgi:hypothetical protein